MTNDELKLLEYLKHLGIKEISKKEKKLLLDFIKENKGFNMAHRQIEFLYSLNKVLIKTYSKVSVSNMMKINEALDNDLFVELLMLYYGIQQKGLNKQDTFTSFKSAALKILENNQNTNLKIQEIISGEFSKLEAIRNVLYISMLDTDKADLLLQNCIKRSKLFLSNCDIANLATMISFLKENYSLNDEDFVNISSKCATFFAFSSAQKIQNIETTIKEFKEFITSGLNNEKADKKVFSLLSRDFKDIIMNNPSFVASNPDAIKETIRFLMGESLDSIVMNAPDNVKGLKGKFTPGQLAKIYSDSITALTISPSKVGDFASNISLAFKKSYGCDLNLNNLINGRNFSSLAQLRNEDYLIDGKVNEIFDLLKPFVSETDMQNLLENNVSFLIAGVNEVKNSLKNAILESRNQEELKANVLHKIKSHFGHYEGFDPSVIERKESVVVDKLKKVSINDMEEELLLEILGKLDTKQQDIENWKNNWSKEEKELRELQIQLDLEDMLDQLNYIEDIAKESLSNIDTFEEDNMIIISLLREVISSHSTLIANNKLNKNLKSIDAKVIAKISNVIDLVNNNIDSVTNSYREEISKLNQALEEKLSTKSKHDSDFSKLQAIEEELANKNMNEETLAANREKIKNLSKLLEKGAKDFKATVKADDETAEYIGKLYNAFVEYETEESFKDPMKIGSSDYSNTLYMFTWFAKILIREELTSPKDTSEIEAIHHKESDLAYSYNQYRNLLTPKIRKIADTMYKRYSDIKRRRYEIYEYLYLGMENLGIDASSLHGVKHCLTYLYELTEELSQAQTKDMDLIRKKKQYQKKVLDANITSVDEEIERLKDMLEKYDSKIKAQQATKII